MIEKRTGLDRCPHGRRKAKKRRRLAILFAAVFLLFLCLLKATALFEKAIAEPYEKQTANKPPTTIGGAEPLGKTVYLTFDDGPSEWTGKILDVLQEHDVKATFFMQGSQLQRKSLQNDVKRAVREGHYIGGHSMTTNIKSYTKRGNSFQR